MPIFDLPLEELMQYQGKNPCPQDHQAYWEAALAELDATDPQVELVKSPFQAPGAECFDLYFTGVRGARVHAKYLRPAGECEPHPAVLQFHGYGGDVGDWADKLAYVHLGYSVFAMNCRGQGGNSTDVGGVKGFTHHGHIIRGLNDAPENLLFRHIFLDTAQLARVAMNSPEVDGARVGAMGGSQGGALTLACVALAPQVKKAASQFPFLCDYKRVWEMDLAENAYRELRDFFRLFDPQHKREEEIFTRLGYIDIQFLAPRIKADVVMGVGLMDQICPPSTQFAAYNKISSPKRLEIYPDYGHEYHPGWGDHVMTHMLEL